ncbi:hypothetical protein PR202_gb29533 [Eleusine coracana subsp. coracana]|uniref:Reverse transcriptase zinc-binding domain-containing protein n=1 Tax=Eleusine coracana subsp. coracana TaxID=191504 RepID=A0AAV5FZV3_ELECO|nr:hypothetical protein PR202_gb29533 [Eleusine coracana subsp. coracana]
MGWALQIRWLWFKKTDKDKPWSGLEFPIHSNAVALFNNSTESQVGNGLNTLFWADKWLLGCSITDLAPLVVTHVTKRTAKTRTVAEALMNQSWTQDIQRGLSMIGLFEFFQLWDVIQEVFLNDDEDLHLWKLEQSGQYSSRSAYHAYHFGKINFEPWRKIWKSWAPAKCKIFIWLAVRNRCWTADRLAKRNLPHPSQCPLCDQEEDVQHLLTTCVFARELWFKVLQPLGLERCVPSHHEKSFASWWRKATK